MTAAIKSRVAGRIFKSPDKLEAATLIRQTPGRLNAVGEWAPGTPVEIAIRAAVAPISGKDREVMPEGLRGKNIRKFWTEAQVRAIVEGRNGRDGDVIRHDGLVFQAYKVDDWGAFREVVGIEQD